MRLNSSILPHEVASDVDNSNDDVETTITASFPCDLSREKRNKNGLSGYAMSSTVVREENEKGSNLPDLTDVRDPIACSRS